MLATAADVERTLLLPESPRLIVLGSVHSFKKNLLSITETVTILILYEGHISLTVKHGYVNVEGNSKKDNI